MPDGTGVTTASLETIDFARLAANDPTELNKLLQACEGPGIFYVDLQGAATQQLLTDYEKLLSLCEKYFEQPNQLKMQEYNASLEHGYKPGEHEETFEILRYDVLRKATVLPAMLSEHSERVESFISLADNVNRTLLSCLGDTLKMDFGTNHRDGQPGNSSLKLYYEPMKEKLVDVVENKHTDMGTLTLLLSEWWGVHMEFPGTQKWAFVEPRKGHAVVNVGDSLQRLSGKRLHSCVHRVTQPHDGFQKRFFVVYFLRPEDVYTSEA